MFENWKVLVVGAGAMGHGIAQVFATNGFQVTLSDIKQEQLDKAKKSIAANMENLLKEGLVTEADAERTRTLITYEVGFEKSAPLANLIVESVFENPEVKRDTFIKIDKLCSQDCILASNTSASNIFEFAKVSHPERLIITHWFNPPFIMPLVEIVMGPDTSSEIAEKVKTLLKGMGKEPALIKQYIPGFIVNRLDNALTRECCYMISQGWTTGEDIDTAIRGTNGIRYSFEGPMALKDLVGWDLINTVSGDVYKSLCNNTDGNPYAADMVAKGTLGLKSGKGVYDYSNTTIQDFINERGAKIIKMIKAVKEL
ncbi:3-hydroxyacyl-CoA dehydrogenase family protein [Desulfitobacterium sp. Sab5]|uniref:3-hydroxyacyl-CoA dehydrogenase family protein n=1 Tax=Desulfitobacterium nosdiversum TaxID=3375356 RepID=UPI003CF94423